MFLSVSDDSCSRVSNGQMAPAMTQKLRSTKPGRRWEVHRRRMLVRRRWVWTGCNGEEREATETIPLSTALGVTLWMRRTIRESESGVLMVHRLAIASWRVWRTRHWLRPLAPLPPLCWWRCPAMTSPSFKTSSSVITCMSFSLMQYGQTSTPELSLKLTWAMRYYTAECTVT